MRSIFYMICASASFAGNDICNKVAVQYLPVPEILTIRGIFASIFAFALVCAVHGARTLPTITNRYVVIRSIIESLVGPVLITAYFFLPVATVTSIMQFGPFVGMIVGVWLFREQVGWRRWLAAIAAFCGVMLIIKPGGAGFQPVAFIVLIATLLTVLRDMQSRKIGASAPPFVVSLATSLVGIVIALILAPLMRPFAIGPWGEWVWPAAYPLAVTIASSAFLVSAHAFAFLAFRSGDMAVVSPFRYFNLLFAVIGGIFVFAEWPDRISILGMLLVVTAGIYLLHRERMRAKKPAAT